MIKIEISTPYSLIKRIRDETDSLRADLRNASSYDGPDPAPETTARKSTRLSTLCDVLRWIEEEEEKLAVAAIRKHLQELK